MEYSCEMAIVASQLVGSDGLLTDDNTPTLNGAHAWEDSTRNDYYYADLGDVVRTFVDRRNLLEGNAAQCCR